MNIFKRFLKNVQKALAGEKYKVKIKEISYITHDVINIVTEKPENFKFNPGQATNIAINKNSWKNKERPFTFTSLPDDEYLEFVIKTYPSHKGVTNELLKVQKGDELILRDVYGTISYKGEGIFIAGGAGITPFISILRNLKLKNKIEGNKLIFANKTKKDIILKQEFKNLLGDNFINILSDEQTDEHYYGFITEDFIKEHYDNSEKYFYLCGPPPMIDAVEKQLKNLNVEKKFIVKEKFQ